MKGKLTKKKQIAELKINIEVLLKLLSLEIYFKDTKLISNSGYFQNYRHQLNSISKSTATHSTLCINNRSSCKFNKNSNGVLEIEKGIKILKKNIILEKDYWCVTGSHDGYLKKYGIIHERKIEFFSDLFKFKGIDKLIKKKNFKSSNFEIRFHLLPSRTH